MRLYEAFGLEPALSLDPEDLKKRFYDRSRQWHPDRFSRASATEQEKALEMTSVLNDAFRTLRDPVSRAEYFLKENGIELSKEAPPELLEEVFELNMVLEELRGGDESARPQLIEARAKFLAMREAIDRELAAAGARYDTSREKAVLDEIRAALNRRRYIRNLITMVEADVENVLPN
ncbi:MAG TPA: Fe-S protein assembly co-chaperone HscB [Bryobacteraceae bacterium]|nr:Fe-S protein assembly co-chaperone HscB [Bryobacteraceae bacterium]